MTRLGVKINANRFWTSNSKGKYHLEDLGVDRKILYIYIYIYILIRFKGED